MPHYNFFQIANAERLAVHEKNLTESAALRNIFLSKDTQSIRDLLKSDLQPYMDGADIRRIKLVTLDDFVPSFFDKLSYVYRTPPVFRLKKENKAVEEKLNALFSEVQLTRIMHNNLIRMKLHNTFLNCIKYFEPKDKMYIDNSFDKSTCGVIPYLGYELDPAVVYRRFLNTDENEYYVVWDEPNKDHYFTKDKPKFNPNTYKLEGDKLEQLEGFPDPGKAFFPFVTMRYEDQNYGFWQNGADSFIELVRIINMLLTVTSDDTVQETIRLLILNFKPVGTKGEDGYLKGGLRHPLYSAEPVLDGLNRTTPDGKLISAELYTDDIKTLIDMLIEIVSGLRGIGNILKADLEKNLSGVAIRLRNEPILNVWSKDIVIVRQQDLALVAKLIEGNNFYRPDKKINPDVINDLIIDYQRPALVTDESYEYEIERQKWQDGTSSPVEYVLRKNPELKTPDNAKKWIAENLKDFDEIYAAGGFVPNLEKGGDNNEGGE